MNATNSAAPASSAEQSSTSRVAVLALGALLAPWLAAWLLPAFAQPQSYHDYADRWTWLGLPHAADVLSNLPFLAVGALGLHFVLSEWRSRNDDAFFEQRAAWPYVLFFLGVLLTAFGSAWYHAQPSDTTLVWDRLPMALGFAGLVAGTLADRDPHRSPWWLLAFAIVGAGTVLYWHMSTNLVPYLVMQAGFIAAALIATAWIPSRFTLANRIYAAASLYGLALIFERLDHPVHALLGEGISGHTLKHLVACAAIVIIYSMLRKRRAQPAFSSR